MAERILLAGGNGYIGGAVAHLFREAGIEPVILDNFSTSQADFLDTFEVKKVDLTDLRACRQALESIGGISTIFHFAAHALVGESWAQPGKYYRNNLGATLNLAESAASLNVPYFIHSSSCTVYGIPPQVPINERSAYGPISPYGDTKVISETILDRLLGKSTRVLNLRYFNPAGAINRFQWGEKHDPETHLIPRVVESGIKGQAVPIFGKNHPTPDGTCIRDFIHIEDLAQSHLKGLEVLKTGGELPPAINIGRGAGHSVLEVVQTAEKLSGKKLEIDWQEPREGDPAQLVADTSLMRKCLGWEPKHTLEAMVRDDWKFREAWLK